MSDEEKAEEIAKEICKCYYCKKEWCKHLESGKCKEITLVIEGVLKGLSAGRKEKFEQVAARHKAELQEVNEQNDKLYEENKTLKNELKRK